MINSNWWLSRTSTSIRLDDILHSSVETLGSAGFKALLLPELKLDGQLNSHIYSTAMNYKNGYFV